MGKSLVHLQYRMNLFEFWSKTGFDIHLFVSFLSVYSNAPAPKFFISKLSIFLLFHYHHLILALFYHRLTNGDYYYQLNLRLPWHTTRKRIYLKFEEKCWNRVRRYFTRKMEFLSKMIERNADSVSWKFFPNKYS